MLQSVHALWPFLLIFGLLGLAKVAFNVRRLRRIARSGIKEIDVMGGTAFEIYLMTLFRRLGYRAEHTGRRGDFGADLIVTKDGRRTVVQAKRLSKRVGLDAVREVSAAKSYYGCDSALVVSNQAFTPQARELAAATGVQLWGREELISRVLSAPTAEEALSHAAAPGVATCGTCGVEVSEKVRDYCLAHAARFGDRVFCFEHQRSPRSALAPSN